MTRPKFILIYCSVMLLVIGGILILNSPLRYHLEPGDVVEWRSTDPFNTRITQKYILDIRKDKDGMRWVQYQYIHDGKLSKSEPGLEKLKSFLFFKPDSIYKWKEGPAL